MQIRGLRVWLVGAVLAVALSYGLVSNTFAQVRDPQQEALEAVNQLIDKPAPPFKLGLLGGGEVDLAKHLGKDVVVLDFWASWCPPCRIALPKLVGMIDEYQTKLKDSKNLPSLVFYGVNLNDPDEMLSAFLEQSKLKFTVALDKESVAAKAYKVSSIPQTVIIGADGKVKTVHMGMGPDFEETLRKELDAILAGKPVGGKEEGVQ